MDFHPVMFSFCLCVYKSSICTYRHNIIFSKNRAVCTCKLFYFSQDNIPSYSPPYQYTQMVSTLFSGVVVL